MPKPAPAPLGGLTLSPMLSLTEVAAHTGISRTTLKAGIDRLARQQPHRCRNPQAGKLAELFHAAGGPLAKVYASEVRRITDPGLTQEVRVDDAPAPARTRHRLGKREEAALNSLSNADLAETLRNEMALLSHRDSQGVRRRIAKVVGILLGRQAPLPQGRALGETAKEIAESICCFGSFGNFLARAVAEEPWLFVVLPDGRPIDWLSATANELNGGRLLVFSMQDYLAAVMAALVMERQAKAALFERQEIERVLLNSKQDGAS